MRGRVAGTEGAARVRGNAIAFEEPIIAAAPSRKPGRAEPRRSSGAWPSESVLHLRDLWLPSGSRARMTSSIRVSPCHRRRTGWRLASRSSPSPACALHASAHHIRAHDNVATERAKNRGHLVSGARYAEVCGATRQVMCGRARGRNQRTRAWLPPTANFIPAHSISPFGFPPLYPFSSSYLRRRAPLSGRPARTAVAAGDAPSEHRAREHKVPLLPRLDLLALLDEVAFLMHCLPDLFVQVVRDERDRRRGVRHRPLRLGAAPRRLPS